MQSQSIPGGGGSVPLVSTATSKPRACSASRSSASSWSSGSPPVSTVNRAEPDASSPSSPSQAPATASASAPASANPPPPGPSVPTKSVSQNRQTASARPSSRPLQRLHPAKRQNTAGLPALAPSPWRV